MAGLTGDLDTYMDEITKNAGDFYEFSQMNVLQQDALAEALNMSSDQLADMLLKEENILDLRERARQEGKEQLYDNLTQLSAQEAFNAALEKMKKLFINIAANIENIRIPKWMSKMLTGRRDTLGGKRLADIANEDTFESSMKKLTGVTTNDDVYSSGGPVGGRRAPSLALNPPNYGLPVNTAPSVTAVSSPPSAITRDDINNLTQATRENKTISVNKFGRSSSNYFDSTKFSYGKM